MTATGERQADWSQIDRFVAALFRHADHHTFVSLRAFHDDADGVALYDHWTTIKIADGLGGVTSAAWRFATECANAAMPVVFCPPVSTFGNPDKADTASLANGLTLSVELDADPAAARAKIEAVLGPPTVAVASGGMWTDPNSGAAHDKLHLHWRLAVPTRTAIEHDFLRECRKLATTIAGADASNIPASHPIRWPGSWHRKGTPRLACIIAYNPDIEIDWKEALNQLRAAAQDNTGGDNADDGGPQPRHSGEPQADPLDIAAALACIPNDDADWENSDDGRPGWNTVGLATWRASGGSPAGYACFAAWSSKSYKFNRGRTEARWAHYATSPPDQIGAGSLFFWAKQARPDFVRPSERPKATPASGAAPAPDPLQVTDPITLQDKPVPPLRWIVPQWVPRSRVTGLYGPGGEGKTLLSQQLMTACALGQPWIGQRVVRIKTLGVFCEDDADELHRRQADINRIYDCEFADLENMKWLARLGCDNLLLTFNGHPTLTPFWHQVLDEAREFGAQLVVVDTVADTFGGDENDRSQVRFYIQAALGGLARALDGAVLATAHPSRAGMLKDGTGDSGSTGWDAGFRSRLSLRTPQPDRDGHGEPLDEADPYARVLQRKKANYAPREDEIELFWKEGVFYPKLSTSGFLGSIDRRRCEDVFLALLDATNSENQPVSSNSRAGNYAPRLFVRRPERDRCKNGDFERAMQALFAQKRITNVEYGRTGDTRTRIVRTSIGTTS